jgi:hypothetical protein
MIGRYSTEVAVATAAFDNHRPTFDFCGVVDQKK